jgi:hypothetical protein
LMESCGGSSEELSVALATRKCRSSDFLTNIEIYSKSSSKVFLKTHQTMLENNWNRSTSR